MQENWSYEQMLDLPHYVLKQHHPMPVKNRAAQFAPFAALTGYGEAVREAARLVERDCRPEETEAEQIDRSLRFLTDHGAAGLQIRVTFFRPDARKAGGAWVTRTGVFKKIDTGKKQLVLTDGTGILVEAIRKIEIQKSPKLRAFLSEP